MAVFVSGNAVRFTEEGDTIEGKFLVTGVLGTCGTGNWRVRLSTGPDYDYSWLLIQGNTRDTHFVGFDPPLPIENIRVEEKGVCPTFLYFR